MALEYSRKLESLVVGEEFTIHYGGNKEKDSWTLDFVVLAIEDEYLTARQIYREPSHKIEIRFLFPIFSEAEDTE